MKPSHSFVAVMIAALLAGMAFAGRVFADTPGPNSSMPATTDGHHRQSGSILVLPAAELINRPLKDQGGHDAGQIRSIVLNVANGAVDFVVVGGRGNFHLNGQVIALPWSVLVPPTAAQGTITVKVNVAKLAQAPRLNDNALAELNQPHWRAYNYGYYGYGYPGPYAARGGYGGPNSEYFGGPVAGEGGTAAPGSVAGGANRSAPPHEGTSNGGSPYGGNRRLPAGAIASPGDSQLNRTQRQLVENGLVVGPKGVVSVLQSRSTTSANAAQAATVVAGNGDAIGRIDQVLIDPERGEVAFVLLERGGFLGLSPAWFALPIEALNWAPYEGNYILTVNERLVYSEPSVPVNKNHLPTQVSEQDLAQLYQHFGIAPYWEQGAQAGQSGPVGPQPQSGSSRRQ